MSLINKSIVDEIIGVVKITPAIDPNRQYSLGQFANRLGKLDLIWEYFPSEVENIISFHRRIKTKHSYMRLMIVFMGGISYRHDNRIMLLVNELYPNEYNELIKYLKVIYLNEEYSKHSDDKEVINYILGIHEDIKLGIVKWD